jgi:hypothetical protein
LDFQFDETADLRRIKLLNVVDEFTREALAIEAAHRIDSDGVVGTVEHLVASRGAPAHLQMDNGPELTAAALRDWCGIWGTHTAYIEPSNRGGHRVARCTVELIDGASVTDRCGFETFTRWGTLGSAPSSGATVSLHALGLDP